MNIIESSQLVFPDQLIILGRGMNEDGTIGELSEQRALALHEISERYNLRRVIFSGNGSTVVEGALSCRLSEAEAMEQIANLPDKIEKIIEDRSTTTSENFILSAPYIDRESPIGIVAHRAHLPRAFDMARRALGREARIVCVPVEEFGAPDEGLALVERANDAASLLMYSGAWGMESFVRRDEQIKSIKQGIKPIIGATILRSQRQYN